jgi:sulfide dehydrogenase [flavocytochrome c] flavoprotein chain
VALLAGKKPEPPALISSCYSLIAPDYAISQRGTYRPVDDQYAEADGGAIVSAPGASRNARKDEAGQAHAWYRTITGEVFG